MADKVNKEESIARVYQFLNTKKNWKEEADLNSDNTIIKTEFRTYLLGSNFKWNPDEDSKAKNDIISAFWSSIDVNTSGTVGAGSKVSNQNALDGKELNRIDNNILANTVVSDYINQNNIAAPSGNGGISAKYQAKWKDSVKAGILNQVVEYLKSYTEKFETKEDLKTYLGDKLAEFCQISSAKATADYKALDKMDELAAQFKNTEIDYKPQSDDTLNGIIDAYISSDDITKKSSKTITSDINILVNAYIVLADDDASNDKAALAILQQFDSTIGDYLNPLQIAVITAKLKDAVVKDLQSTEADFYKNNAAAINSAIESYANKTLSSSSDDFNTIIKNMSNIVKTFKDTQLSTLKTEYNQLVSDRAALVIAVGKEYNNSDRNSERKAAIKQVFGSDEVAEYTKNIQALSRADFDAKKAQFEALIKAIDAKLPDSFLNQLPNNINAVTGGSKSIELPNNYGQYTTGHLHYKASGDGVVSISDTGVVTIKSGTAGVYKSTITVYNDEGMVLASKDVTINVMKDIASNDSLTFNGVSLNALLNSTEAWCLHDGWSGTDLNRTKVRAVAQLKNICNTIANSLTSNGYPSNVVNVVRDGVISYFNAIIYASFDSQYSHGDKGHTPIQAYYQFNGKTEVINTDFYQHTRADDNDARNWMLDEMRNGGVADPNSHSGICIWEGYTGNNSYGMWVSAAAVIKKFQELMSRV